MAKAIVRWLNERNFVGTDETDHSVVLQLFPNQILVLYPGIGSKGRKPGQDSMHYVN